MNISEEVRSLWGKMAQHKDQILYNALETRGLKTGRSQKKTFTPTELTSDRLYLGIVGRNGPPKQRPYIRHSDFEAYLQYEKRDITLLEAKKSFRTSYVGPLIEKIRGIT